MIERLSHRLDENQPNWPGAPGLELAVADRIGDGDGGLANTHVLSIYSHYGSHVDLPYHFLPDGARMAAFDVSDFHFTRPAVVRLALADRQLVTAAQIESHAEAVAGADLVLIRSGFEAHRADTRRYIEQGPGFSEAAALAIRAHWPAARAIGIDWLSLCALSRVDDGAAAHRALLAPDAAGRCVLIFEDLRLTALRERTPRQVWAMPLFVDRLDGSPCTVIAEV